MLSKHGSWLRGLVAFPWVQSTNYLLEFLLPVPANFPLFRALNVGGERKRVADVHFLRPAGRGGARPPIVAVRNCCYLHVVQGVAFEAYLVIRPDLGSVD